MIDIKLLRDEPERVREAVRTKNGDLTIVDTFLALDDTWRTLTAEGDALRADQKKFSAERNIEAAKANKESIKENEEKIREIETKREALWMKIPNLPSDDTPIGKDDSENKVIRTWGEPRAFDFEIKDHVQLGESLGVIDTETAGEVSSARFAYLKGDLVRLQFALVQYVMDTMTDEKVLKEIADAIQPGYSAKAFIPVVPPVMIRADIMQKMARLEPRDERYHLQQDDLYLVGSAEHTLGPIHMNQTLTEAQLPIRYLGYSTSFRREAGSYGKDTKGILRLHQFDKLEFESFTTPEHGIQEQDFLVALQEYLVQGLKIPYQVLMTCTGDQGDPDARHLDIEMWMPGQQKYRETHSADYMTDYQSRRLGTRVKRSDGKTTELVHMNDATAFAIGRTLIAIMENYQTQEGRIKIPDVLQKYIGKEYIGN
jgi:seryl-tRNA synthetase